MERISSSMPSKAMLLYPVKDKIALWNSEKLTGIGFKRAHDKYCYLEICIYDYNNYPDKDELDSFSSSFVNWKVDGELFPISLYDSSKKELFDYANFIVSFFNAITGKPLKLIFEINFAGYHPTDVWGKGVCGWALINAVISCFDENLYKQGLGHRTNFYDADRLEVLKRMTAVMNKQS